VDLNPLEFGRLQQTIKRWHGDAALLNLDNRELAQALHLVAVSKPTHPSLVVELARLSHKTHRNPFCHSE
jgi:hypothetical protein